MTGPEMPAASVPRRAFTLVEALVALSLAALAGGVLLLAAQTSLTATTETADTVVADGMARQLLTEILSQPYGDPFERPLGPPADMPRERFASTGDYHGYRSADGVEDPWRHPLGSGDDAGGLRHMRFRLAEGTFSNWRQEVTVEYLDEDDLSRVLPSPQTSNFRRIEVTIYRDDPDGVSRRIGHASQVIGYAADPIPAP